MTARTRKATTTATTAKKTTARKTTTKKTPATRTRLSLVKPEPAHPKLPTRTRPWMTDTQGHATLTARIAGITTWRINDWRDHRDGTCTRTLADGSTLHYQHDTRTLTWQAVCRMGAIHQYALTTPSTATAARIHADRCTQTHASLDHIPPLTADELEALGLHTGPTLARPDLLNDTPTQSIPVPLPDRPTRALADQLTRTRAATTDTQPMNTAEIAAALTARADNDQPKEHPQP